MDLTLVPFGYSISQQQLVDVHQVASGKRCGCECPSCRAPLIARKGNKKIWHFAHDSRSRTDSAIGKCRYSFYVSVRMMARQLIGDRLSIKLPRCEVTLSERVSLSARYVQVSELVTQSREIVLDDVSMDTCLGPNKVDLSGFVDGYCLAVVFTHPGREDFGHFAHLDDKKSGVVAVSLTGLHSRFSGFEASQGSYKKILEDYLSSDVSSKSWIFHPRLHFAELLAKSRLADELATAESQYRERTAESRRRLKFDDKFLDQIKSDMQNRQQDKRFVFICRLCNSSWTGVGNKLASCQKCGTSLLVSKEEMPDSET